MYLIKVKAGTVALVEKPSPGRKGRVVFVEGKGRYDLMAKRHGFESGKYFVLSSKGGKMRVIHPKA